MVQKILDFVEKRRRDGGSQWLREEILRALAEMGGHAYTLDLWKKIDPTTMRVSIGALYIALGRLADEGYVSSAMAPGGPERGYKQKRSYGLTEKGRVAAPYEVKER